MASRELHEVAQDLEPDFLALLGMELAREDVGLANRSGQVNAVLGLERDERRVGGDGVVGVHEVDVSALGDAGEQRIAAVKRELVPPDMRDFYARLSGPEPHDAAGDHAEPGARSLLLALVEQDLQAEADPQVRPAARDRLAQGLAEAALAEPAHEHAERALARHDDLVGAGDGLGIAGDDHVAADLCERTLDGAQVPRADIDDGDHVVSVPLVDGTAPPSRGSMRVAASHARANALKMHSIVWWA